MSCSSMRILFLSITAGMVAACGDGGSGTPPPISTPPLPPPPPPEGPPPAPAGPIGLVSDEPFESLGVSFHYSGADTAQATVAPPERAEVELVYRASDGSYVVTLPDFRPGVLQTDGYSGSWVSGAEWQSIYSSENQLLDGESGRQDARISLSWPGKENQSALSYTSWGAWGDDPTIDGIASAGTIGFFAYGVPTPQGQVPITGTATYDARVIGRTDYSYPTQGTGIYQDYIDGTAQLRFDFGSGTLEGEMNPVVCPWDCYSLGTYNFAQTVYSAGSPTFSGVFAQDGVVVPSWFEGNFNGPQAQEIMARWQAPYTFEGGSGVMGGIWVGARAQGSTPGK